VSVPKFQNTHYYKAKPKVDHETQIESGSVVARSWRKETRTGEVERIADQNRRQRSPEVSGHNYFDTDGK
jgi:hypothetical protein